MAELSKICILIMVLVLSACGGDVWRIKSPPIYISNKPSTPFVMPEKPPQRIFTAPGMSFYLDEQGKPTTWGKQTCMPENLVDVVSIAGMTGPFAAVKRDGTVETWSCSDRSLPIPSGLNNVKALAVEPDYTLVLKNDGSVEAWGWGHGVSQMPPNLRNVVAISAGKDHGLALHSDGRVTGWDGPGCCSLRKPFTHVNLSGVVAIASGDNHNLALRDDGTIVSWGSHSYLPVIPTDLTDKFGAIAIAVEGKTSYALLANGDLVSWEWRWPSQSAYIVNTLSLPGAVYISKEWTHGLAQKEDGGLLSWGKGLSSLLPSDLAGGVIDAALDLSLLLKTDGDIISSEDHSVTLKSSAPVVRVNGGAHLFAALHSDGVLSYWGVNYLVGGTGVDVSEGFADVKDFAFASNAILVVLKTDGTVFLSGINLKPQLVEYVTSLRDIESVHYSGGYFVARNNRGELIAWRLHDSNGLQVHYGPSMIRAVAESYPDILVLRTNGTVAIWNPESSMVTDVAPELDDVVAIAGGHRIHFALKRDGTVRGINAQSPYGVDESATYSSVPDGLNDVIAIYSGYPDLGFGSSSRAAITRSGKLIVWGGSHLSPDFYRLPE